MKLPSFKRIFTTDFPEKYNDLVGILASVLNYGIEVLYNALNNKLSVSDNFYCSVNDVQLTVNSAGVPLSTTTFQLDNLTAAPIGLQVIKADNVTNSKTYPSAAVFVTYTIVSAGVQILQVTGLQANNIYKLRILSWG